MQKNDYVIEYRPWKDMVLADRLSHFPSHWENISIILHHNIQHVHFSSNKWNWIQEAVERDPVHSILYRLTLNGWPHCTAQITRIIWHFWVPRMSYPSKMVSWPKEPASAFLLRCSIAPWQTCMKATMEVKKCKSSPDPQCTAWYWHWYCQLHLKMYHLYPAKLNSSHLTNASLRCMWWLVAGHYFNHRGKDYLMVCNAYSKYPFT